MSRSGSISKQFQKRNDPRNNVDPILYWGIMGTLYLLVVALMLATAFG